MSGIRSRGRGELADVQEEFSAPRPAYTTILTALDRLVDKGEVARHAESPRRMRFSPTSSAAESASKSMRAALGGSDDRRAALLQFAGDLSTDEVEMLRSALDRRS
jgi:predicted transcriptional regulator